MERHDYRYNNGYSISSDSLKGSFNMPGDIGSSSLKFILPGKWHNALVVIPECCIRGNHRRGSLSDSLLVRVAFLATFYGPSLHEGPLAVLWSFHRSNVDATQTSIGDRKLDVKGSTASVVCRKILENRAWK